MGLERMCRESRILYDAIPADILWFPLSQFFPKFFFDLAKA